MWFGNLVTMQLVERPLAQRVLRRVGVHDLPGRGHPLGRRLDHLRHPREGRGPTARTSCPRRTRSSPTIRDLEDVEVNFDGITYAKGASVLKQLVAYVGREPFVAGLRAYFAKHAWGNTTLADLLDELEATSGRDLRTWSQAVAGDRRRQHAAPRASRSTTDGRDHLGRRSSRPAPPGFETLRPHRLAVGPVLPWHGAGRRCHLRTDRLELDVDGERTDVPELVGRAQPDLLLVNDDDLAYAKIRLDERSLATALAHPRGFTDSLPRAARPRRRVGHDPRRRDVGARPSSTWSSPRCPGETDSTLLRTLLGQLQTAVHALHRARAPRGDPRPHRRGPARTLAQAAEPGSDAQLQLVTAYAGLLSSPRRTTAYVGAPARRHGGRSRGWPSTPRCAGRC